MFLSHFRHCWGRTSGRWRTFFHRASHTIAKQRASRSIAKDFEASSKQWPWYSNSQTTGYLEMGVQTQYTPAWKHTPQVSSVDLLFSPASSTAAAFSLSLSQGIGISIYLILKEIVRKPPWPVFSFNLPFWHTSPW